MAARKTAPKTPTPTADQASAQAADDKTDAMPGAEKVALSATPAEPTPTESAPEDKPGEPSQPSPVLVVTAPRPRRRAGRAFGKDPIEIPLADLSKAERAAIESDPVLTVKIQPAD